LNIGHSPPAIARALVYIQLVVLPLLPGKTAGAQQAPPASGAKVAGTSSVTPDVYRRFADRVVKVQIIERSSAAKASLGSGFYVADDGSLVTNYHVISQLVHHPSRYRVEVLDATGAAVPATLLAIDVIHDLAVLRRQSRPPGYFALASLDVSRGDRLYSLGHPEDLGLSIIEGTYNGLLQYTLYPKIHFTGSLNPGMSGGPAIDGAGHVVGVNVSTMGNQVSFLVPIEQVIRLVERVRAPGFVKSRDFLADVGRQLLAYQDEYITQMFGGTIPTVSLGGFVLPTAPARFLRCWADAPSERDAPYDVAYHRCSTEDAVYITEDQSSGIVELEHRLLTSGSLNSLRFSALYTHSFDAKGEDVDGNEDVVTRFRCTTDNVDNGRTTLRAALCLRRYRRLPGLYDVVLRAAVLGRRDRGIVTVLQLSGVSFENAQRVTRHYLQGIAWQNK
jgi:serine protease Do